MSQVKPATAQNVNDIAELSGRGEARDAAHHALKSAIAAYASMVEALYDQPKSISSVEVDNEIDKLFAAMDEAHKNWMSVSGSMIKPI